MRRFLVIFALLAFSRASFADPIAETPAVEKQAPKQDAPMAIAVNNPLAWFGGSVGVSLYRRVGPHQALRFNVATHPYGSGFVGAVTEDEASYDGRILDVGAAWMYFPRRVWDGPTLEVGLLRRAGETHVQDEYAMNEIVNRDTQLFAGRVLVGWSWYISDKAMISFAVGSSGGYETGRETDTKSTYPMSTPVKHEVGRWTASPEAYLRFGFTFGE